MTPLRGHKYLILLTVLVGGLIGQSLHHTVIAAPAVLSVLQTITVVAVFLGVFEERRNRVVALWLGIVTAVVGDLPQGTLVFDDLAAFAEHIAP